MDSTRFGILDLPLGVSTGDIDGVIGWGTLGYNLITLDAFLRKPCPFHHSLPRKVKTWSQFKLLTNSYNVLLLEVPRPSGPPFHVYVDTGDMSGVKLFPRAMVQEWKSTHKNQPLTLSAYFTGDDALEVTEKGWAKELDLGLLQIPSVPVTQASKLDVSHARQDGAAAVRRGARRQKRHRLFSPQRNSASTLRVQSPGRRFRPDWFTARRSYCCRCRGQPRLGCRHPQRRSPVARRKRRCNPMAQPASFIPPYLLAKGRHQTRPHFAARRPEI